MYVTKVSCLMPALSLTRREAATATLFPRGGVQLIVAAT